MHRPLAPRSWCRVLSVAVAALLLDAALPARAGMIISVQDVSAKAGTTGNTLEVDLQNTGTPVDIAAFSFEISVAAGSGVSFTGAYFNTLLYTYIFYSHTAQGPSTVTPGTSPGLTLDASDNADSVLGSTTLGTGSILALGRVFFDVTDSAPTGSVTVSLTGFPFTSLAGPPPGFSTIPVDTLSSGTITITQGSVVPEPSAVISGTLGFLGAAWMVRRMRATLR